MIHCLEIDGVFLEINNKSILSNIYLQSKTKLVSGLFGRNGAGKSSLMKIIFGALDCEYSLRVDNKSIRNINKRNEFITFLPQFNFIPKSLSINQALCYFDLDSNIFEATLPEFKNKTKMKLSELSGGQRRFIELYVILLSESKFALLDEPFTLLSPLQIEKAKQFLMSDEEEVEVKE
jgi:ABC-type multidrug transport system ATPase subunit